MPLQIIRQDITKIECDAIVNAANKTLLGGGGVDGAIHKAAGKGLLMECMKLHGCGVGEAKVTGGYRLPAKYVIHTVGPKWHGGDNGEETLLRACYRNSLNEAKRLGCASVAFPLISTGVYGYPVEEGFRIAVEECTAFLAGEEDEPTLYITVFGSNAAAIGRAHFGEIAEYIDDNYVDAHTDYRREALRNNAPMESCAMPMAGAAKTMPPPDAVPKKRAFKKSAKETQEAQAPAYTPTEEALLDDSFTGAFDGIEVTVDEGFSDMLLRKIDERGMKDSECYKKANIDRKLFSKIRSNPQYKPSKPTVLAFAVALELSLEETKELLLKAGFALSHSYKFDIIVEYFIKKGIYDIYEINEALFAFDQALLGSH